MALHSTSKHVAAGMLATAALTTLIPGTALALGLDAANVDHSRFVMVAAPITGSGGSQLQIYEQVNNSRACYSVSGESVEPLLVGFDFTNICQRYIDSNGYSLRIGNKDLGTTYRLSIRRSGSEHVLMAIPTRPDAGSELRIARATGDGSKFLRLEFESGWSLRRRQWQGTNLGHLYVYRATWPELATDTNAPSPEKPASTPSTTTTAGATDSNSAPNTNTPSPEKPAHTPSTPTTAGVADTNHEMPIHSNTPAINTGAPTPLF